MTAPRSRSVARYGWVRDLPDARDHVFTVPAHVKAALPAAVDLRSGQPGLPPCYDQGQIGSCTANAIAGAVEFALRKEKLTDFLPSRLFVYYNERAMEGHVGSDSGAQIRDGVKSVSVQGVPPETEWPYEPVPADSDGKFPVGSREATKPSESVYEDALKNKVTSYQRVVQSLDQLRGGLAAGYPVLFGFTVYQSFESETVATTGVAQLPTAGEQVIGGHAVLAVGYDDAQQRFIVRNSWGTDWGMGGYFTLPYAYLTDSGLASDFWTVRVVA
ncbi:MAG TPA: C1 family peptidase [Pseudonocardiaceae bacterium]|nr:C1 family peptidase [Pseudonocardiaceae bacterium]